MNFIFSSPSLDDLIRLLRAWRFWVLSAIIGALIGAAVYYIAPPPYRARATVNVDFNLEEAFPTDNDRQYFYYLERETRKLIEIAWSDSIIYFLSDLYEISVDELRSGKLKLSQPGNGGWHFYVDDKNPILASKLVNSWAHFFKEMATLNIQLSDDLNSHIEITVSQTEEFPKERSIPLSSFLLAGSSSFLLLAVFVILFIKPKSK